MDPLELENKELREGMTSMQAEIEKLTAVMTTVLTAQNQISVPQPASTSLAQPNTYAMPISTVFASSPQYTMLKGYLWTCLLTPVKDFAHMSPRLQCSLYNIQFLFLSLVYLFLKLI